MDDKASVHTKKRAQWKSYRTRLLARRRRDRSFAAPSQRYEYAFDTGHGRVYRWAVPTRPNPAEGIEYAACDLWWRSSSAVEL